MSKILCLLFSCVIFAIGCAQRSQMLIQVPQLPPPAPPIKAGGVALVLSSGGFRGGAHVGVIEVLAEHGVPIDLIVASSAGAFVGALYAEQQDLAMIKRLLLPLQRTDLVDPALPNMVQGMFEPIGASSGIRLQAFLLRHMQARTFRELQIPLVVVATELYANKAAVFASGPIAPAVQASSAMPPVFSPVQLYQRTYIDGGVIAPVPIDIARRYQPKFVIAVNISKPPSVSHINNAFGLTGRALDISFYELAKFQSHAADITIHPVLTGFGTFEDGYNEAIYHAGRRAALEQLPAIQARLKHLGLKRSQPNLVTSTK